MKKEKEIDLNQSVFSTLDNENFISNLKDMSSI